MGSPATPNFTWLSALAMLLQGHATAAWLWIVSRRLCLGQEESRRVQSGPCQHSRSWLHRAIFSLVALVLAGRVHTLPMQALDSDLVPFCSRGQSIEVVVAESDCAYLGSASSLSKMSSFLMWSLLVTPSIFRRHDISNTLSRFCCVVFSVQVPPPYSVLSIIVS